MGRLEETQCGAVLTKVMAELPKLCISQRLMQPQPELLEVLSTVKESDSLTMSCRR